MTDTIPNPERDPDRDEQEISSDDVGQLSDVLGEEPLDRDPQPDPDQVDPEDE